MTRPQSAIAATGLRKSFGDHLVLDGIDLDVAEGTIFALLGPNGAGKTTIVQILSTLIGADAGEIRVAGHDPARDPDAVRAAIGVTGQFSAVDNLLTGKENLILMADLHHLGRAEGRRRAAELLDRFDLAEAATKTAATYSGGMRRRLDLAMGLVADPRIVFLDEPTTGLDPRSRRTMWQIDPRPRGGRRHGLPHDPVSGRGRPPRRPDRGPRPRQAGRRGHRRRAQAARPRRSHQPAVRRRRASSNRPPAPSRCRTGPPATTTSSPCSSRATAASSPCGPCSTASTPNRSTSTSCRSTPPISTTSSSPSPATPTKRRNQFDEHPDLRRDRLGDDAAAPAPAHAALPVDDGDARRHADRPPAAVRLRVRRHARRRTRGRLRRLLRRPRRLRQLRHSRRSC